MDFPLLEPMMLKTRFKTGNALIAPRPWWRRGEGNGSNEIEGSAMKILPFNFIRSLRAGSWRGTGCGPAQSACEAGRRRFIANGGTGFQVSKTNSIASEAEQQHLPMKTPTLRWFPRRWAAAILMLAASGLPLFAQVNYVTGPGRIIVDLELDGTSSDQAFQTFFNNPSEHVTFPGKGLLPFPDGTANIRAASPAVMGTQYREFCTTTSQLFNYPYQNQMPLITDGLQILRPGPYLGEFEVRPATGQIRDPSTQLPMFPDDPDVYSSPFWLTLRFDLTPTGDKHYYANPIRSNLILLDDPVNVLMRVDNTRTGNNRLIEDVGAINVTLLCDQDGSGSGGAATVLNVLSADITATADTSTPIVAPLNCLPAFTPSQVKARVRVPYNQIGVPLNVTLLVEAGRKYMVQVDFVVGSAGGNVPGRMTIPTGLVQKGEILSIQAQTHDTYCDQGPGCVGAIGELDIVGTTLKTTMFGILNYANEPCNAAPSVAAAVGPWGISTKYAFMGDIALPIPGAWAAVTGYPSYNYKVLDPLPSSIAPPGLYQPSVRVYVPIPNFQVGTTIGGSYQYLDIKSEPVAMECLGPPDDWGQMFNMTPGTVQGNIKITGPVNCPCLQSIHTQGFNDPCDIFPFDAYSTVSAIGSATSGATAALNIGQATIRAISTTPVQFDGEYKMLLVGTQSLDIATGVWSQPTVDWLTGGLVLKMPGAGGEMSFGNRLAGGPVPNTPVPISPGSIHDSDHLYCVSSLKINFISPGPDWIASPRVVATGALPTGVPNHAYTGLSGVDNTTLVDYTSSSSFRGSATFTPTDSMVEMCIAEGKYSFAPTITFATDGQGSNPSTPQLPPFEYEVGCAICYTVTVKEDGSLGPVFKLKSDCVSQASYTIQGTVKADASKGRVITSVSYKLNGGQSIPLPGPATALFDLSTTINSTITLQPCLNTIEISAMDDAGCADMATFKITLDSMPPSITTCPPPLVLPSTSQTTCTAVLPDLRSAVVATDDCDVTCATCNVFQSPQPNSTLVGPGPHPVVLTVKDACGNVSLPCTNWVTIESELIMNCPADIAVDCQDDSGAVVNYPVPVATSPCCLPVTQPVCTPPPGLFPIGVTTVHCNNASDTCGHTKSCSFKITVKGLGNNVVGRWARKDGGTGSQTATAIAVDAWGNSYVAGSFVGTATFTPPAGPPTVLASSGPGDEDAFLAKYDTDGRFLWAVQAGGVTGADAAKGVAVDVQGNCFLTGLFHGAANFSGLSPLQFGGSDIFLAKYNSQGAIDWVVSAGGTLDDAGTGVAVGPGGDCFVTGVFRTSASFPGTSGATLSASGTGTPDCFLAKYNPAGVPLWVDASAPNGNASYWVQSRGVAVNAAGEAWIVGVFSGNPFFHILGPTLAGNGHAHTLVVKHNASSGWQWARQTSCASWPNPVCGEADGRGIGVDGSGNCYFTAYYTGDARIGTANAIHTVSNPNGLSQYDCMVGSFGPGGQARWLRNGLPKAVNMDQEPRGLTVDAAGNVLVTGFLDGPGLSAAAGKDVWLRRFNNVGALVWSETGMGTAGQTGNAGRAIGVDPAGCVYVTGSFRDQNLVFSDFTSGGVLAAPSASADGTFLVKYCPTCCATPPPGLVAWYPMDNTTLDYFGQHNPSSSPQVTFVPGKVSEGGSFTTGSGMSVPDSAALANPQFTLDAWVHPLPSVASLPPLPGRAIIVKGLATGGDTVGIYYHMEDGRFRLVFGSQAAPAIVSSGTFAVNQFHFVAATFDGTTLNLYVNGALQGTATPGVGPTYNGTDWTIGVGSPQDVAQGIKRTWAGIIDEVEIFNRALDGAEVQRLFAVGDGGKCKDPCWQPARVSIQASGNAVTLSWAGPGQLQSATSVTGPWSTSYGAVSPHTTVVSGVVFFRVICP